MDPKVLDADWLLEDMARRSIKIEFLNVPDFFVKEENKEIDEAALVSEVRSVNPQVIIMMICYSQCLDLKSLLERAGLFPTLRINRDLNILSRGQILTMNDAQKEFIETFTLKENIEKNVVISGPVGSGKTIMGLEALKMKQSHYMKKYGLSASECKSKFRVIIGICAKCDNLLVQKLRKELSDENYLLEVWFFCHACLAKCKCAMHLAKFEGSGQDDNYSSRDSKSYIPCEIRLNGKFYARDDYKSYIHTFIMLDEVWSR